MAPPASRSPQVVTAAVMVTMLPAASVSASANPATPSTAAAVRPVGAGVPLAPASPAVPADDDLPALHGSDGESEQESEQYINGGPARKRAATAARIGSRATNERAPAPQPPPNLNATATAKATASVTGNANLAPTPVPQPSAAASSAELLEVPPLLPLSDSDIDDDAATGAAPNAARASGRRSNRGVRPPSGLASSPPIVDAGLPAVAADSDEEATPQAQTQGKQSQDGLAPASNGLLAQAFQANAAAPISPAPTPVDVPAPGRMPVSYLAAASSTTTAAAGASPGVRSGVLSRLRQARMAAASSPRPGAAAAATTATTTTPGMRVSSPAAAVAAIATAAVPVSVAQLVSSLLPSAAVVVGSPPPPSKTRAASTSSSPQPLPVASATASTTARATARAGAAEPTTQPKRDLLSLDDLPPLVPVSPLSDRVWGGRSDPDQASSEDDGPIHEDATLCDVAIKPAVPDSQPQRATAARAATHQSQPLSAAAAAATVPAASAARLAAVSAVGSPLPEYCGGCNALLPAASLVTGVDSVMCTNCHSRQNRAAMQYTTCPAVACKAMFRHAATSKHVRCPRCQAKVNVRLLPRAEAPLPTARAAPSARAGVRAGAGASAGAAAPPSGQQPPGNNGYGGQAQLMFGLMGSDGQNITIPFPMAMPNMAAMQGLFGAAGMPNMAAMQNMFGGGGGDGAGGGGNMPDFMSMFMNMMNMGPPPGPQGLSPEQIEDLPTSRFQHRATDAAAAASSTPVDDNTLAGLKCCICLSEFEQDEMLRSLPCFHRYHVECIDEWLGRKPTCPLCKHDATPGR